MNSDTLETPAALVDLVRVRQNVARVLDYCARHDLKWRPHVKTHKSVTLARLQRDAGVDAFTVATPREAEVMSLVSGDLLLAHPPVGGKLDRVLALPPHVTLRIALDDRELVSRIAAGARAAGRRVGLLVELDVGMGRMGVQTPIEALALARTIDEADGVRFDGVCFYPGHIRSPGAEQGDAIRAAALKLGRALDALHGAGLPPGIVSGGSTPTLFRSHEFPGVTEIRPGTAIFHDRESAGLGAASLEDVAYTVLATVVSTAVPGQVVVDAGSKALSKEEYRSPGEARSPSDPFSEGGFGVVWDRPEVRVRGVSEEHGILDLTHSEWRPKVGDRVRIVPNHVCVSVNLQDELWGVPEGEGASESISLPPAPIPLKPIPLKPIPLKPIPIEGRGRGRVTADSLGPV
jgi:D-serine deaminase-like pyridoxal phosphate-dependent protein